MERKKQHGGIYITESGWGVKEDLEEAESPRKWGCKVLNKKIKMLVLINKLW